MNKKQFEIWERQKRREYRVELEKLQDDLAARGLTFSGARIKAEEDLKEKYDSEIEIMRLELDEDTKKEHVAVKMTETAKGNSSIDWGKWSVITAIIIFVLGLIANYYFQPPTISYAPQNAETKVGDVIQVQGNGNTIVLTLNHKPITQYNILSPSKESGDNLFHTRLEVLVSFDKQGGLHISPKIYCEEFKDRERRVFQFEGNAYSGLVFNLDCKSSELMEEGNSEYFEYINNG